jgi:hypothetical protein
METMQATSSIYADSHTGSAFLPAAYKPTVVACEAEQESMSLQEYGSCVQGFLVGLMLEGALALCLYGMYRLGHILP